ncbi:MAG: hypothetical protein JSV34_01740 [Candidatus Omnitrophota bacterium]|nr:MAG: hypothetical protein JSV34_01740 [Candidatus Omnitrophota bacterium]
MLYYVFTVDGDWHQYFDVSLPEEERIPNEECMREFIEAEVTLGQRLLAGKFIHFIHASPRAREFFLKEPFIEFWHKIINNAGDIGIHCHEDDPSRNYYFRDIERMRKVILEQVNRLKEAGLPASAYRGGYLTFCKELIPVLEEANIRFDFSCEPGRYLVLGGEVVSDWRGAPDSLYRMSYSDQRRPGNSSVFEVPIGAAQGGYLYFEKYNKDMLGKAAESLEKKARSRNKDIIVSVLTHSYDYDCKKNIKDIEEKTALLKKHGRFINLKEVLKILGEGR